MKFLFSRGRRGPAAALFSSLVFVLAAHPAHAQSANKLYSQGRAAEARDDVDAAFDLYSKAWHKKPSDEHFKISYERLRVSAGASHVRKGERLRDQGDDTGALTEFLHALEIDPSNELALQDMRAVRQKLDKQVIAPTPEVVMTPGERQALETLGAPPELKPMSSEPLTLHMTEDSKVVYQTIGKAAGINVLFDPAYKSTRIQIDLTSVSLFDALRNLGLVSGTFWRPVTSNTIFVAENTRGKRTELEEEAVQTFYLTNVSQQNDLNDMTTALRNVFTTAKLYGVPSQNAIIMRGTPDELLLAEKLINDLDKARAEVVVDIAVLEVSRDKLRTLGVQLPQTASVAFQASNANQTTTSGSTTSGSSTSTTGLTLNNLAHLNSTNFAVTIGSAAVNLILTDTDTRILQNPRLRASDNQKSSVKIGERLPVATGSYSAGATTAVASSLVNTQFQYLDVGVNVEMTPTVHFDRDVSLKLKIEVSSTNGTENLGGINEPIITQRTSDQVIRLREGEASILTGILEHQHNHSVSGYPGLGELPLLKWIFSTRTNEDIDDEIVFLLIPHVVRAADITPLNLRQVDTGTTNSIELRRTRSAGEEDGEAGAPQSSPSETQRLNTPVSTMPPPPPGEGGRAPQSMNAMPQNPTMNGTGNSAMPRAMGAGSAPGTMGAASAAPGALAGMQQGAATAGGAPTMLELMPPRPVTSVGSTIQMQVMLAGGTDVYAVPLQMQYDQSKLTLINVDSGDFLGKDGQAVALVHRDDGAGGVQISASRPPGVAGVNGNGMLCTLTFQAKAAGDASVAITRPVVRNSKQQAVSATGSQAVIHIQ